MGTKLDTPADVIKAIGTPRYADALGIPYETAASHKRRNSIPGKHWHQVAELSGGQVTVEQLARMHARPANLGAEPKAA